MTDLDVILPEDMLNCPRCCGPAEALPFDERAVHYFCTPQTLRLIRIASRGGQ